MKRLILGVILGAIGMGILAPAGAVKTTPKPTVTVTATPVADPSSYLKRYCYGLDMVYMVDNSEWNHTPSTLDVVANSPACTKEKASAGLRIVK